MHRDVRLVTIQKQIQGQVVNLELFYQIKVSVPNGAYLRHS